MRAASSLLGFLRPRVLRPHTTASIVKKTACESMVLGMLLYGSECWTLTSKLTHLLENFHHRAVRTMNAVSLFHTRKHCLSTAILLHRIGLCTMQDYLDKRTLGWAGHVARMPPHRWPRKMLTSYLPPPPPHGAPQKTYGRCLTDALARKCIPVSSWLTMALDRTSWRRAINSLPATPSTPINYIGRTIVMRSGAPMQALS
jgi:hypothetical protein